MQQGKISPYLNIYFTHVPKFQHFFETINPLSGFDGKESFETYMWEQSLKVEPKDPDKMEIVVSSFILFYKNSVTV